MPKKALASLVTIAGRGLRPCAQIGCRNCRIAHMSAIALYKNHQNNIRGQEGV